jgi:RHS repeat-associated protein
VFTRSGTTWTQQGKLRASDAAAEDYFGVSVAVSGDYAVVGAYADDDAGSSSGSAYVFKRTGTSWSQQAKLTASDAAAGDQFGSSAAIWGDSLIVGARLDDDGAVADSGSAYVFTRSGTSWTQEAKLTASDAAAEDRFGNAVGISQDSAIVGAYYNDDGGGQSGSAYVFKRSGMSWSQQAKLRASDAAAYDYFGNSVSIWGENALVGAYCNDDGGSASGSAYLFSTTDGDRVLYYLTDANHNVTALVDGVAGEVLERYVYDAYGRATVTDASWTARADGADANTTPGDESAFGNELLYAGYRYDPETALVSTTTAVATGNYLVRTRQYSPLLGQFTSRDPIGYSGGTNLYEYVGDNPFAVNSVIPGTPYITLDGNAWIG